jgi:hypothetical protein
MKSAASVSGSGKLNAMPRLIMIPCAIPIALPRHQDALLSRRINANSGLQTVRIAIPVGSGTTLEKRSAPTGQPHNSASSSHEISKCFTRWGSISVHCPPCQWWG